MNTPTRIMTRHTLALLLGCTSLSGCITVSEFQDARVLPRGETRDVVGLDVHVQRGVNAILVPDNPPESEDKFGRQVVIGRRNWPQRNPLVSGVYRYRRGWTDALEWNLVVTFPFIRRAAIPLGLGVGLKGQVWGRDPEAQTAGAWLLRADTLAVISSTASPYDTLVGGSVTAGFMSSFYSDIGLVTLTPKARLEGVTVQGGKSALIPAVGAGLGIATSRRKGSVWGEISVMAHPVEGGLTSTFGIGYMIP